MKADKGFSLLEVIIALSIVSSCVLLFSFAISQVQTARASVKDDRQIEWHLFINQLENDLHDSREVIAGKDGLTFEKFSEKNAKWERIKYEQYYKTIRRRVDSAGHQPMLLEVSSVGFTSASNQPADRRDFL
ncbi:MAG: competence type IV pilus minor pilin ComGF [Alkalibacterium sp.]|nr:competence type IV pilus minor pilin ComGF [Alkalibacterium sp.]